MAPLSIAFLAAGLILILAAHVLVLFLALRRCGGANADLEHAAGEGGGKGLSADEIETLPCHEFSPSDAAAADCTVCLEAFEAGDRCRLLPRCEHSFHAKCVDPWLGKSRWCPVCRADVVAGEGETTPALTLERRSPAALAIGVT